MMTTELTVGELLERLRDLPDDTPVRLAKQYWLRENHLGEPMFLQFDFGGVVYLPEAEDMGSLSLHVSSELGWQ